MPGHEPVGQHCLQRPAPIQAKRPGPSLVNTVCSVRRQFKQSGQGRRQVNDLVPAGQLRPGQQKNSFTFCEANAPLVVNGIEFMAQA
jgi:hypothetical protein